MEVKGLPEISKDKPSPPETLSPNIDENLKDNVIDINVPEMLKDLFTELTIEEACFVRDDDEKGGHHFLITVPLLQDKADELRDALLERGVGTYFGTFSLLPLEVYKSAKAYDDLSQIVRPDVEKVVRSAEASAKLEFDFMALCIVASILSAAGLATNNTVIIVASMLVSPLMGPIVSMTFGAVVLNGRLVVEGIYSEIVAFMLCFLSGFCVAVGFAHWGEDLGWPTPEMESRGIPSGLIIGIVIAIPSGVGVALSVLSNNAASLVGVAISAALLPPAVNVGICFYYALYQTFYTDRVFEMSSSEFMMIGAISFSLYLLNIVCIFLAAVVMFKYKEVYAPRNKMNSFWWQSLGKLRARNRVGGTQGVGEYGDYCDLKNNYNIPQEILEELKGGMLPLDTARLILGKKLTGKLGGITEANNKAENQNTIKNLFRRTYFGGTENKLSQTAYGSAKSPKFGETKFRFIKPKKYYHKEGNYLTIGKDFTKTLKTFHHRPRQRARTAEDHRISYKERRTPRRHDREGSSIPDFLPPEDPQKNMPKDKPEDSKDTPKDTPQK